MLCRALRMLGADVANPEPRVFNDLEVELWPRVSWSPFFAVTFSDLKVRCSALPLCLLCKPVLPLPFLRCHVIATLSLSRARACM